LRAIFEKNKTKIRTGRSCTFLELLQRKKRKIYFHVIVIGTALMILENYRISEFSSFSPGRRLNYYLRTNQKPGAQQRRKPLINLLLAIFKREIQYSSLSPMVIW